MRIAVLTPLFNAKRFIGETLASIAQQIRPGDEVVVVDDGSTDGGGDVARRFGGGVQVIVQKNGGEASAVNAGLARVTAPIVGVVNADDPILEGLLDAVRSAFQDDDHLAAVYPDWVRIDASGAILAHHQTREFSIEALFGEHLCIPGPGAFFKRACLPIGEPFRDPAIRGMSDYDFWLRFAIKNRSIRRIPKELATWRSHDEGTTYTFNGRALAEMRVRMVRRLFDRNDLPEDIRKLERQSMSSAHYNAALAGLRSHDVETLRHTLASYAYAPLWPQTVGHGQRRSPSRLAYALMQPMSSRLHEFLNPVLPARFRRETVLRQTFGVQPGA